MKEFGTKSTPQAAELLAAADACDAAARASSQEEQMRAVLKVWEHKETIQLGMLAAQMKRVSENHRHQERLPFRDDGDDIGIVEARIPKRLFFHLQQQGNFGMDGFCDNGGMRDFLKAYPACKVKTVSGKTTVGWRGPKSKVQGPKSRAGVVFGRGTINLAT